MTKQRNRILYFFFKNLTWKQVLPIFILGMVDMFVFLGPLYLRNVFPNPQKFLNISKPEFDQMTAIWGYTAVLLYFPSGWLADKVSNKLLVIISSVLTGALAIWWTTVAQHSSGANPQTTIIQLGFIYALWGVSTTLTFWSPLWRLLSQQVDDEHHGTAYGLEGTFNGLFGVVFVTIIGYFLLQRSSSFLTTAGLQIFGYSIAVILFLGALLVWRYAKEKEIKKDEESRFSWRKLWMVLKSGRIWLAALLVNGIYFMQHELAFLVPYMKNILGVSGLVTVIIAGGKTYAARVLIATPVGRFGDKAKSFMLILVIGLTIAVGLIFLILFLPGIGGNFLASNHMVYSVTDGTGHTVWIMSGGSPDAKVIFVQVVTIITIILLGILTWIIVTLRFAQVAELPTPKNSYGTVIGFISLVAFSSNGWFNQLSAFIEDKYPMYIGSFKGGKLDPGSVSKVASQTGSEIIIGILIGVASLGLISGWILYFWTRAVNKREHNKKFKRVVNNN